MELALILKFIWKNKHTRLAKGTLKGKGCAGWGLAPAGGRCSAGSPVAGAGLQPWGGGGRGGPGCPQVRGGAWVPHSSRDLSNKTVLGQTHNRLEEDKMRSISHMKIRINSRNQRLGAQGLNIQIPEANGGKSFYKQIVGKGFPDVMSKNPDSITESLSNFVCRNATFAREKDKQN